MGFLLLPVIYDIVAFNIEWNNIPDSWKIISDYGLGKSVKFKAVPIEL